MDIKLFISHAGRMVVTCYDSAFTKVIDAIELDCTNTMISVHFRGEDTPVELNCPVHSDSIGYIMKQRECAVGFIIDGALKNSCFVPLRITGAGEQERRANA